MHKHKCSLCETLWQHGEEWDDDIGAHECPACGCHQFRIFRDADTQGSAPAGPDPVVALGASDALVRARTAFSLDARAAEAGLLVPKLAELVTQDPYPLVRLAAVEALWRFGAPASAAVAAMTRALADRQAFVRRSAALALGSFGTAAASARPHLTGRLTDSNPSVRAAAATALKNIGPDWFSPLNEVWVVP
jgi:hypothetical protein